MPTIKAPKGSILTPALTKQSVAKPIKATKSVTVPMSQMGGRYIAKSKTTPSKMTKNSRY